MGVLVHELRRFVANGQAEACKTLGDAEKSDWRWQVLGCAYYAHMPYHLENRVTKLQVM